MSRRPFRRCTALAAWAVLTANACGKGLYTTEPVVGDVDAAIEADASAADVPVDAPTPAAFDAYPDQRISPDVAADVPAPGASLTASFDLIEGSMSLGIATLYVPREAFAQKTDVTLTLISDDGKVADHPGAIGPIFSLSKAAHTDAQQGSATLQIPATLTLAFTPADTSIPLQRLTLAYLSTVSNPNLWIPISNPSPGTISGSISEFFGTVWFAPVESCPAGQSCPAPETCKSNVCQ